MAISLGVILLRDRFMVSLSFVPTTLIGIHFGWHPIAPEACFMENSDLE